MAYTLTLLGTDTQFTPEPLENAYDVAETLSYLATKIQGKAHQPMVTDSVTQYRNQNVAVVNGPTTLGTEVGDRIARGVEAILEAVSRGETQINIMAHSRGAVEAILVAHELQRIQDLFKNKNPVALNLLTESVCNYTKSAMRGTTHKDAYDALKLEQIVPHIANLKLSMFNIDPVPGGNYLGITHASTLAWKDPRFYQKVPPIVAEYEQYVYQNERTRCFKPIVPDHDSSNTHFKLESLPGHHGTGSGNLLNQQRKPNAHPDLSTDGVQKLVIAKGIDFLIRNEVEIVPPTDEQDPFLDILAPLFKGTTLIKKKLNELYYDLYNNIIDNIEAYRDYNNSAYATLGKENDWARMIWTIPEQRIIHHRSHNDTFLEMVIPPVPGGTFLNYEHARLHLNNNFEINNELSLSDTISRSIEQLIRMCTHAEMIHADDVQDLSASFAEDKVAPAANDDKTINLLLSGLSMLIEEVKRPYLLGELKDNVEREKIYAQMTKLFTYFNKEQETFLGNQIQISLRTNLELTLETKFRTLESEYSALSSKLKKNVFFDDFRKEFQQLISNIEDSDLKDTQLHKELKSVLTDIKNVKLTYKSIKSFLDRKHLFLSQLKHKESPVTVALLLVAEALDDAVSSAPEQIMKEVIELQKDFNKFKKSLPDFKNLYADLPYDLWGLTVESQGELVLELAGEYCAREQLNIEKEVRPLFVGNNSLYQKILGRAVAHGANPFAEKLEAAVSQINRLSEQNNSLARDNTLLGQRIIVLQSQIDELIKAKENLELANTSLTAEKTQQQQQFESQINDLIKTKENLELANTSLIAEKTQQKKQLESQLKELTNTNDGLEKANAALAREKEDLVRDNRLLNEQISAQEDGIDQNNDGQIDALRAEIDGLNQEKNAQNELLNSESELQCQLLIKMKLIPLTGNYLKYLAKEIKKTAGLEFEVGDNIAELISAVQSHQSWIEANERSLKLWQKFQTVSELYQQLTTPNNLKPSQNVTQFYSDLNAADQIIGAHRDSKWKRYTANAVAVLGIILTGVLPGLAILALVAAARGKTAKFWQSEGQGFFDKSTKEIEENPYSAASLPKQSR